jgi:hypothetical protein
MDFVAGFDFVSEASSPKAGALDSVVSAVSFCFAK